MPPDISGIVILLAVSMVGMPMLMHGRFRLQRGMLMLTGVDMVVNMRVLM